jgi:citrate lyase subunit beta/citryl-CoA lyase
MDRSYLFAPGHNERLLGKVFEAGADSVMLDLEDAVPPEHKQAARRQVAEVLVDHPAWVRVNAARTAWCEADLGAVAEQAFGIRIPKTESADDVAWVAERAPGKAAHLRGRKRSGRLGGRHDRPRPRRATPGHGWRGHAA